MNKHAKNPVENLTRGFSCPDCKGPLVEAKNYNQCHVCSRQWPIIEGIPSFVRNDGYEQDFYEMWHEEQALNRRSDRLRQTARQIVKPLRYFATKRERLFRRAFAGRPRGPVLDIACGIGQPLYNEFGSVIGVDLSLKALALLQRRGLYKKVVHADARRLPFPDATFKYIVSADFFGHVPIPTKNSVISEMNRVLAPDGIMAHVIEGDSKNLCFQFAHRYPDLFQKYFVDKIGGHYGLEMPTVVVERFKKHGLKIVQVEKMWGPIWDTRQYVTQFSNEYVMHSRLLRGWILICRLLSSNPVTMIIADALLGLVSSAVDRFQPLDNAQGVFLVAQKIR